MLRFYYHEIALGQANMVMFSLLMLMVHFILAKKDNTAGAMLGLAVTLKPYAIIFLPYLLLKKRYKATGVSLLVIILALCIPSIIYGVEGNIKMIHQWVLSLSHSTPILLTNLDNVSLFSLYAKWFGTGNLFLVYALALMTIIIFGALFLCAMSKSGTPGNAKSARSNLIIESSILMMLMPLLSPQGWDYVIIGGTLGLMLIISQRQIFPRIFRWLLYVDMTIIAFSIYDILGRSLYRSFMRASILTLCFLYLAVMLIWLRIYDKNSPDKIIQITD